MPRPGQPPRAPSAPHAARRLRAALGASGAVLLTLSAACDGNDVIVCAPSERRSVIVAVTDSASGQPAAAGARGVAEAPGIVDSLDVADALVLQSRGYRTGVYTVRVEKAGYAPWRAANVTVRADGCFAGPARLAARLQPAAR